MPITRRTTAARTRNTTFRTTGNKTRSTSGKTTAGRTTTKASAGYSPSKFNDIRQNIQQRVGSYRNIYAQVSGASKVTAFSPKTAQQWTKFINNGCNVYKFNTQQCSRFFGQQQFDSSTTNRTATQLFRAKFGAGVKAVAQARGNAWLVAATNNVNQGPFKNYKW